MSRKRYWHSERGEYLSNTEYFNLRRQEDAAIDRMHAPESPRMNQALRMGTKRRQGEPNLTDFDLEVNQGT